MNHRVYDLKILPGNTITKLYVYSENHHIADPRMVNDIVRLSRDPKIVLLLEIPQNKLEVVNTLHSDNIKSVYHRVDTDRVVAIDHRHILLGHQQIRELYSNKNVFNVLEDVDVNDHKLVLFELKKYYTNSNFHHYITNELHRVLTIYPKNSLSEKAKEHLQNYKLDVIHHYENHIIPWGGSAQELIISLRHFWKKVMDFKIVLTVYEEAIKGNHVATLLGSAHANNLKAIFGS
mgnify:CR=1 FL=1|uniref:Uncharacterized protein n=1 Tax=viral metagenome TaxID=1070528 RepID=A0A6C0CMF1_9ZZZZ